jgi:hypothetical protein
MHETFELLDGSALNLTFEKPSKLQKSPLLYSSIEIGYCSA